MKQLKTGTRRSAMFDALISTRGAQAAMMTLRPGQSSSDHPENEHPRSEQWLFVISGTGTARVAGRSTKLRAGELLLIEKGEPHQITASGRARMVTLNFYVPPAYTADGEPRR
jgi:mannose-6-phosphate isomerase-like protein (cupin superfamily)